MEVKMSPEGGLHVPGLTSNEVHTVDDVNRVTTVNQLNFVTALISLISRSHIN